MVPTSTEIALIKRLNEGSTTAFDELYAFYHKMVYANIYKVVKRQEEAEELLQDVFVALWKNRLKIDSQQTLAGWLSVVSHNKAINHLNKSIRSVLIENCIDPVTIANVPDIEDASFELQVNLLNEAIERLSPMKKQVFTLCKIQGKTYTEAASILHISPNTVKEHIVLATKFIRTYAIAQYPSSVLPAMAITTALMCGELVTIA